MNTAIKSVFRPESTKRESLSLTEGNGRLKEENAQLRSENEQLRQIFDYAVDQFNGLKKQVEQLKKELVSERSYRKELEKQNKRLKKDLNAERAKANKFSDMLFGLKSEKLKLSDIKIVNKDTLVINEKGEAETDGEKKKKTTGKHPRKKKKGARKGHHGKGRKIPENLPVIERVISLPEGEIIHGIPAEDWVKQEGMEETSLLVRKKVFWYVGIQIRKSDRFCS